MTTKYSDSYFKFLEENKDLIDSRIIQLIQTKIKPSGWESLEQYDKKLLKNYSGLMFGDFGIITGIIPKDKVYIDSPYFSIYRLQSICGSLYFALKSQITPISDNPILSSFAQDSINSYPDLKLKYTHEDLSKILALKSFQQLYQILDI